ncbi:unnamed protein product [Rhizophagus irregularis]|nr:unnamed protein product [Rhizophagus irregularis]
MNHNEERSEEIIEERSSQPTQSNTNTYESPAYPLYSPRSYTVSEDLTPVSSHNTSFSPELSVSPTYSPVSPEYIPANRELSPYHSYIEESIEDVINGLRQESSLSSPNSPNIRHDSSPERHEIEPISQSDHLDLHDNDTICSHDSLTIDSPLPSSSRESSVNNIDSPLRTSNDYYIRSHVRIQPLGSSQSDCCPDLGLPDELVLYTTKYDLLLLDPKLNLKILRTEKDLVHRVDTRRYPIHLDFDRLNMVEVIPELSLMIVASQQGKVALTRLIRIVCDDGEENYYLHPEKYLPNTIMNTPLLGMFVAKHNKLQDPALFYYRLYLMYINGTMFCYEIRRKKETNPLRMDNIYI